MTTYGLTPDGFVKKPLTVIKKELEDSLRAVFGAIDTSPQSTFGQIIGVLSERDALHWELSEDVYYSQYPASSEGLSLDGVSDLVGVARKAATKTQVICVVEASLGTIIPQDNSPSSPMLFRIQGSDELVQTKESITVSASTLLKVELSVNTVADTTLYSFDLNSTTYSYTSDASATEAEILAGLKAEIDADIASIWTVSIVGSALVILVTDNDTIFSISSVSANLDVDKHWNPIECECVNSGAIQAPTNSVTNIETPISGLNDVDNLEDGAVGLDIESDTDFRIRRANSVQISGGGSIPAMESRILQEVTGVTSASIVENDDDVVDGDGRPPHSFEAIVVGGDADEIAQKIWDTKPAGIATYTATADSGTAVDSQGQTHTIYFSRPTPVDIYVKAILTLNTEETFPADGIAQVSAAILALGNTLEANDDVIFQSFYAPVFSVQGISSVILTIDTVTPAVGTSNIAISANAIAEFDSSRINVTVP